MTENGGIKLTSSNYDGLLKQTNLGENTLRTIFIITLNVSSIRIVSAYGKRYPDGGFLFVLYKNQCAEIDFT